MPLWGTIRPYKSRKRFVVDGKWQGKRYRFAQIPVHTGFISCVSKEMAFELQKMLSVEIERGIFNPARYKPNKPLHFKAYSHKWIGLQKDIAYKTKKGNKGYLENWLIPLLGDQYLPDINHEILVEAFNKIPLHPKTKKNIHGCFRKIMNDARRSGYIAQLPEHLQFDIPRTDPGYIDAETRELILANIAARHQHIFRFIAYTGLRPSEARALRKSDIKKDHIMVCVTFAPVRGGEALKEVKQKREQAIPKFAIVDQVLANTPKGLSEFVFINPDTGRPYTKNFNRIFNKACKKVGITVSLNTFGRKTFGAILAKAGVDMETISTLMRHSDTKITKDHYTRPDLEAIRLVVNNVFKL